MRTTVTLDDQLLELAKRRAHERHTTLGAVVTEALQRHLSAPPPPEAPRLPVFTAGTGFRPGVDATTNRGLYEALDGDELA